VRVQQVDVARGEGAQAESLRMEGRRAHGIRRSIYPRGVLWRNGPDRRVRPPARPSRPSSPVAVVRAALTTATPRSYGRRQAESRRVRGQALPVRRHHRRRRSRPRAGLAVGALSRTRIRRSRDPHPDRRRRPRVPRDRRSAESAHREGRDRPHGCHGRPDRAPVTRTALHGPHPLRRRRSAERVTLLDREHLDAALLYPTIHLLWECEVTDPEISLAYCRAYNRWIADFCRDSRGRLVPSPI
jgi:hypothetical protein